MLNTTMPCDVECMIQIPSDAAGLGTALAILGLPLWLSWQRPACHVGDLGSIPGLGRSPGEGKGYPLQYSCLENSMAIQSMELQRVRHD